MGVEGDFLNLSKKREKIKIIFLILLDQMSVFAQAVLIIKVLVRFTKPKLPTMIMSFLQMIYLLQIWSLRELVITAWKIPLCVSKSCIVCPLLGQP